VAISKVSVYTRTTDSKGKRQYEQADPRKIYPMGTIFCLRYEVNGKRKWETLTGNLITFNYALSRARMRESDLLTGAINTAKHAPAVPAAAQPEKPARLTAGRRLTSTCGMPPPSLRAHFTSTHTP